MGTCAAESVEIDSLGRRTGPRRQHTIEEKLRIVCETHVRGASVATVARRHNVNPNQVFAWRQLYLHALHAASPEEGSASSALDDMGRKTCDGTILGQCGRDIA